MPQYSGVWSLQQQMQALTSGQWATDPLFDYTTLLLQGDAGANRAQNNVFYDTSPNQFAITRNGNTTQGTFSPFSATGWSNFFDGTGDYLTISDSASLELGSSDFCLECFVNFSVLPPSNGNTATFLSKWAASPNASYLYYLYNDNGTQKLYFTYTTNGTTPVNVGGIAWAPSVGVWYHVAVTRSGSNLRFFVNGVQAGATQTLSATVSDTTANTAVGGFQTTGDMNGYISNARIVIGSPVYTADFAPSTSPLTAITNTRLLTCQNNRFVDNSTNSFSIVVNGNTSVQAFSPFAPQFQYTATGTGGSGYFDGSGDYLLLPSGSTSTITANADFTFECWTYLTGYPNTYNAIFGGTTNDWTLSYNSTNGIYLAKVGSPIFCETTGTSGTWTMASMLNSWNHIAVTRSGNSWTIWINGVSRATATQSQSYTNSQKAFFGEGGNLNTGQGYLSGARYTTAALYSSTFTPSTAPPTTTVSSGTCQLLCNFTNAGIRDATMKNNLETVGNAQVSTSVVKYGSGSLAFDGTGDYLYKPNEAVNQLGTGDYTIEFWVYGNSWSSLPVLLEYGRPSSAATAGLQLYVATTSGRLDIYGGTGTGTLLISAGSNIPTTTWTHVALTRASGSTKLFINGTQTGSTATDNTNYSQATIWIGAIVAGSTNNFNGYLDDFRITKGIARYTQNFIPPSVALPRQ